jgi:hypothetical protein
MWSRNFSSGGIVSAVAGTRRIGWPSTDVTRATTVDAQPWLFDPGEAR